MRRATHMGCWIWNWYRRKIYPDLNFISFLNMFLTITLSSFHKFIFSQACISHHGCEKYSNLWCSDKCRMDLQVKKLKVGISATPRKNSVTGAIITLKAETNYSFPQLRERETCFEMYSFKSTFLKHEQKNELFFKRSFLAKNLLATTCHYL